MLRFPIALIPIAMSGAAVAIVPADLAFVGTAPHPTKAPRLISGNCSWPARSRLWRSSRSHRWRNPGPALRLLCPAGGRSPCRVGAGLPAALQLAVSESQRRAHERSICWLRRYSAETSKWNRASISCAAFAASSRGLQQRVAPVRMRSRPIAAPDAKACAYREVNAAARVQHGEKGWKKALHGGVVGCVLDEVAVGTFRDLRNGRRTPDRSRSAWVSADAARPKHMARWSLRKYSSRALKRATNSRPSTRRK